MEDKNKIKDEIKKRLDIVTLIEKSEKLAFPLIETSQNYYNGAVSASSKSGKSLAVDRSMQLWHNFSSNPGEIDGGDVFDWIAYENNLRTKEDFYEVLRIAAGLAGVQLEELSEEDILYMEEKQAVQGMLTNVAELYHKNLTPGLKRYINKKWGISCEIIDRLKIGYAKPSNEFDVIEDKDTLLKTGLVIKVNKGAYYGTIELFNGRVVFPYWVNGKVVAFAARGDEGKPEDNAVLHTPNNDYERAKYKKLLVYNEKHPYVSKCVNNRYIWGEDTVRGHDYCVVTEGIADAIILMQNDIPVLSPVTTKFAKHDNENLLKIAKRLKTVYICNDAEDSGAGEDGAIRTGLFLMKNRVNVRIMTLPKENLSKMDVAEYFLRHTGKEFLEIQKSSKDILVHLLNKIQLSKLADRAEAKTENMQKAIEFVQNILSELKNEDSATLFIRNNIKEYFPKFTSDDVKILLKTYRTTQLRAAENNELDGVDSFYLDSESGRCLMTHVLSEEILKTNHIKTIAGGVRVYNDGIYTMNMDTVKLLQKEIIQTALKKYKTPIMEKHAAHVVKMVEVKTTEDVQLNENENEIAVGNGILNLQTLELTDFTPEKVFINKIPVYYDKYAPKPKKFLRFMETVFKGNEKQYDLMQEVVGYLLTNNYKYQNIIYLIGDGGNGKGTLLKILTYLLGKENTSSASLYQLTDHPQVDYFVAGLYGKKANICGDVGATKIKNTENLKKLSSNTDEVTARLPYGVPFSFINLARIVLAMNKLPKKDAFTTGDKRRDTIIDFRNKISGTGDEIRGLSEVIRDAGELPGILNWAIEGLQRLEKNQKFSDDRTDAEKGIEYDKKSNPMKHFVDDCIDADPAGFLPNIVIYEAYMKYRQLHGMPELSDQEIKNGIKYWCKDIGIFVEEKRMRIGKVVDVNTCDQGTMQKLGKQVRVFTGIKLMNDAEPEHKDIRNNNSCIVKDSSEASAFLED